MNTICGIILATIAVVAFAYSPGQLVVPGSTRPPQSCEDDMDLNKCADVTEQCSPKFYNTCSILTSGGKQKSYFPNCFGHKTEDEANRAMKDFLIFMNSLRDEECKNLIRPLICFGLYPICYGQYRLAPCPEFCETFVKRCVNPNMTISNQLDCSKLFRSGPCVNNTKQGQCIKPPNNDTSVPTPTSPSNSSTNMSLPNCTGVIPSNDCGLIRSTASVKAFKVKKGKKFYFGAHVKVLEAVLLSKPDKLVAFKVEIIQDYYFDCSSNCSGQKNVSSNTYIITDDDTKDCRKQCIRQHLEIGKEYFVMGTSHFYKGIGHVWKLPGQKSTGGCVIYPWNNISNKKAKKLVIWTKGHYKCIKNCTRVF